MRRERPHATLRHLRGLVCSTPEGQLPVPGRSLSSGWEYLQSPRYADTFARPWAGEATTPLWLLPTAGQQREAVSKKGHIS